MILEEVKLNDVLSVDSREKVRATLRRNGRTLLNRSLIKMQLNELQKVLQVLKPLQFETPTALSRFIELLHFRALQHTKPGIRQPEIFGEGM